MNNFIPLESIHIASPCSADWDAMTGDSRARFCASCQKNVYNLSDMTRAQAQALINEKEGKMCVQYYQRADGTVLTDDCPVPLRPARNGAVYAWRALSAVALALVSLCGMGAAHAAEHTAKAGKGSATKPTASSRPTHRVRRTAGVPSVRPTFRRPAGSTVAERGEIAPPKLMGKPAPPPPVATPTPEKPAMIRGDMAYTPVAAEKAQPPAR